MSQTWMIDVLSDLQSYARTNGMARLEEKLEQTITVAREDLTKGAQDLQEVGAYRDDTVTYRLFSASRKC